VICTPIKEDELGRTSSRHIEMRTMHKCWSGNFKGREYLGYVGIDGRIISKRILEKEGVKA
jgi:hypothetical protein